MENLIELEQVIAAKANTFCSISHTEKKSVVLGTIRCENKLVSHE